MKEKNQIHNIYNNNSSTTQSIWWKDYFYYNSGMLGIKHTNMQTNSIITIQVKLTINISIVPLWN